MPKLKTHKGAAKRFRTTASGKVKRGHSHARHILTKKTAKRKRVLDIDVLVSESDVKAVKRSWPALARLEIAGIPAAKGVTGESADGLGHSGIFSTPRTS